ncbi:MAG: hypothetical protein R3F65_32440 [bacterium]
MAARPCDRMQTVAANGILVSRGKLKIVAPESVKRASPLPYAGADRVVAAFVAEDDGEAAEAGEPGDGGWVAAAAGGLVQGDGAAGEVVGDGVFDVGEGEVAGPGLVEGVADPGGEVGGEEVVGVEEREVVGGFDA